MLDHPFPDYPPGHDLAPAAVQTCHGKGEKMSTLNYKTCL